MANKTIGMTQVKRIIQLRSEGTSKLKISKQVGIHRNTLDDYLFKLELTGKSYQELLEMSQEELASIVYCAVGNTKKPDYRLDHLKNNFDYYVGELRKAGVTRRILWEEYKQSHPDGYGYTQFCEHLARYNKVLKATMHFEHEPARYLQVDFAGKPLHYIDRETGEIVPCPVLVCVLPFSGYPYIEALRSARQEELFNSLSRCVEFFGGVAYNTLSDNMKQFIIKNDRYEFSFSELVNQWSLHYNTNLEATRPRKPKDKASVEGGVKIAYLRVYAKLRNETFYSHREINIRIRQLVEQHVHKPFQKKPGTRHELFINHEQPLLKPLPAERFVVRKVTFSRVYMNYHVCLGEDNHHYSVPYQYIGQKTKIIYDRENVEIFIDFKRIAAHPRSYLSGRYTTLDEHMPPKHLSYKQTKGWDASYFLSLASKIGEYSEEVFRRVLASKEFVEQTYLSCKGLKRLSEIYTPERFEAACKRALKGTRVNYMMIKNILEKNLDQEEDSQQELFPIPKHHNIRGKDNYK